jgi:hypothetical protein
MPTATPTVSSIARTERRPRATPSEITAETGAKNGLLWIVEAIAHAAPAATVVCRIGHSSPRRRRRRRCSAPRSWGNVGVGGR